MQRIFLFFTFIFPILSSAQVVDELIQIDTVSESIQVIYRPDIQTKFYTKKVAVFANDTSQIAIEKSYTNLGKSGLYKAYYPNGKLKIKTVYAKDKLNGEWTYFDSNGEIKTKGAYQAGVKNGFWAYRTLKIYGRYKDGLRHRKWYRINVNNKKEKSTYKKGVLLRGKGFGDTDVIVDPTNPEMKNNTDSSKTKKAISYEYEQAITFLKENLVLKKTLKEYFSKNSLKEVRKLKKYYVRGQFQFVIAPVELNLGIDNFIEESAKGKLVVAKIDSVLKVDADKLKQTFSNAEIKEHNSLYNNSTDTDSEMIVYFSKVHRNLLRIDIVQLKESKEKGMLQEAYGLQKKEEVFEILLYFNKDSLLRGAEYENP